MIYIFDDRAQRRKYNEDKLRDFSDLITFDTLKVISGKSAEESIFDSIENPECIIFHKSYALGDENVTFESIRQLFTSLNIPIVIFSGGTEGSNKRDKEINMNADLMYNNLPFFLENLKENGEININILLWGKRYRLNALLEFQNSISQKYLINNDIDTALYDKLENVKRDIENSCRKIHEEDLRAAIISEIEATPQITWLDLAIIIDKHIHRFQ
ncbi:MAG: hypothetical protein HDS59_04260 [Barnesiella sp.]|nr:hypothetical protein [Barnesiella sp.]